MAEETIKIITYEEEEEVLPEEVPKVFYKRVKRKEQSIDRSVLQKELNKFLDTLDNILRESKKEIGDFEIDRLEVFAEVEGNGRVGFLGTGIQVGVGGGIKIVLKRKSS